MGHKEKQIYINYKNSLQDELVLRPDFIAKLKGNEESDRLA